MGSKALSRWLVTIGLLLFIIFFFRTILGMGRPNSPSLSLATVAHLIKAGQVAKITIKDDELLVERTNGMQASSMKEHNVGLVETLRDLGVTDEELSTLQITVAPPNRWQKWLTLLGALLPVLLFSVFFYLAFRQAQGGANRIVLFPSASHGLG